MAAANGYTEVLEFLFRQSGLNLDIQDNEGWTPFHAAVCWGQTDAMKMLAEKGANMDIKNIHGETAYGKNLQQLECMVHLVHSFGPLTKTILFSNS